MPDDAKGTQVGTADMHGGEVTFKDRQGNEVGFEMVPLGTGREFDVVKAALENRDQQLRILTDEAHALRDKLDATDQHLADADAAYKAEKEKAAKLETERNHAKTEMDAARDTLAAERSEHERTGNALSTEKEVSAELTTANQGLAEGIQRQKDTIATTIRELANANAELSDLMTVKASLEETNTALKVSQKELCAERDVSKRILEERKLVVMERNESRQALAELKASLLADCTTFLDAVTAKLSGE